MIEKIESEKLPSPVNKQIKSNEAETVTFNCYTHTKLTYKSASYNALTDGENQYRTRCVLSLHVKVSIYR